MLNLYFVNVDFPPVSGPGVWRILAFAKYAAQAGHRVTVFCSDRASWHDRADASLLDELPPNVRIVRVSSIFQRDITDRIMDWRRTARSERAQGLWRSLLWWVQRYWPDPIAHWALKCAFKAWALARKERPDCIFTTGPQHLSHTVGYLLRKRLGTAWIMDYRDPWTDVRDARAERQYQHRLAEWLELRFLATADAITVVSPCWLKMLAAKLTGQDEKFVLIRNGHDLAALPQRTELPRAPGADVCRLHFNGSIQPAANILPELHAAVESLVEAGLPPERLRISFCGLPPSFMELIATSPARACYVDHGVLSHDESVQKCLAADALIVSIRDVDSVHAGFIPGKTYEAMALGQHVFGILPKVSDARSLLEEYGNATLCRGTTAEDVATAMQQLLARFDAGGHALPRCPEAHRQALAERYARAAQAGTLIQLMSRLAAGESAALYSCSPP